MKQILRLGEGYGLFPVKRYIGYVLLIHLGVAWLPDNKAQAQTQSRTVSGTVLDAETGKPLEGATVKAASPGGKLLRTADALTDATGKFFLYTNLPGGIISISYIGFQTQTVNFGPDTKMPMIIKLETEGNELEEVAVSTGYQQIPKERATGSFVHIDSALFNRAVSTDVISRLKGIAPSLLFDERAGGAPKLSIRGRSTIFANADPLIVVDNFPYEGDLSNLNPNDIADVSILRDAAAASIWGVRAGNGVIVITTKKGKKNQPMSIHLNSNVSMAGKPDLNYVSRISPSDEVDVEEFLYQKGYYKSNLTNTSTYPLIPPAVAILADAGLSEDEKQAQLNALKQQDILPDIQRYFYQATVKQQYALDMRGGSEKHRYYFAAGYDHDHHALVGSGSRRINISAQNSFDLLPNLELQASLFFTQGDQQSNNTWSALGLTSPYQRLVDESGQPLPVVMGYNNTLLAKATDEGRLNWQFVPLEEQKLRQQNNKLNHYRLNKQLAYVPLPGLRLQAQYQYEQQLGAGFNQYDPDSYFVRDLVNRYASIKNGQLYYNFPIGAVLYHDEGHMQSHNGRFQANYDRTFENGQLNLLAGAEVRETRSSGHTNTYLGYDPENGTSIKTNLDSTYRLYPSGTQKLSAVASQGISGYLERYRSAFFNGSYQYLGRYTASASMRMDQTNLFGVKANQRTVPLWSSGLKWDVDHEAFYHLDWLPKLSLRLTYGYNGNFDGTAKAYVTATYSTNSYGLRQATLGSLPNPELKAERMGVWNAGLEFSAFHDLLFGRVDYYNRRSHNLIGTAPIDPTTGRTSFRGNLAHMSGRGWDVELKSRNLRGRWTWSSTLLFSFTADKVLKALNTPSSSVYFSDASLLGNSTMPVEGKPLFAVYSYPWAGLDPQTGDPMGYLDGQPSKDYAAIQKSIRSPQDLLYHGTALPRYFGSFRNDVTYKQLSLSVNINYKLGYYFRRASLINTGLINTGLINTGGLQFPDYALRWRQPGDELHTQVPSFVYPLITARNTFYQNASVLVEKGDHIRLQDVRLSYLYRRWQAYAYASNLGILWRANKHGIDPDYNQNAGSGTTTPPDPLTVALGIQTTF